MRRARAIVCALTTALLVSGGLPGPAVADDGGSVQVSNGVSESIQIEPGPIGQALAAGYVSFSFEYRALHQYTGRDPDTINPVLLALLRQLSANGGGVLRIGGDSTDQTWWPQPGVIAPGGVNYALSRGWLRVAKALAQQSHDRLLLGINLAANRPALAATEGRALLSGIGKQLIAGFEIGNEPDLYGFAAWFHDRYGQRVTARGGRYDFAALTREFNRWRAVLPSGVGVSGPSLASLAWGPGVAGFLRAEPHLSEVTIHRYPLSACQTDPTASTFASIDNLLGPTSSAGLARVIAPFVALAHSHHEPFLLDELNSASCGGAPGVSDTFASALWLINTLYGLAADGVDGVNLHTLPGTAYQPFSFTDDSTGWHGNVAPIFYGALLFTRGFPAGARLLPVATSNSAVSAWATQDPSGHIRVTLINPTATPVQVSLGLASGATPVLFTQGLNAPSPASTGGINLSGQHFQSSTSTGALVGKLSLGAVAASSGTYSLSVDPYSALLLSS